MNSVPVARCGSDEPHAAHSIWRPHMYYSFACLRWFARLLRRSSLMISQEQANYQRYFHFMPPDVLHCDEYLYERAGKTKHWVRNVRAWAIPVHALFGPPNVFFIRDKSAEYWHVASDCPNP